jgi:sulfite exporter TauE/SafE
VAFSLSTQPTSTESSVSNPSAQPTQPARINSNSKWQQIRFHLLLNLGRVLSYALIGASIGAVGSVLIASGQLAGIGSNSRRIMALVTGGLLIWFGLVQISPGLPKLPILHPLLQGKWHQRLSQAMIQLSLQRRWWTPFLLGIVWGLIPCGFLYAAQIKAAETGNLWAGSATMLAFGLGTMPTMLGVGMSVAAMNGDRRTQLFRLGGWITLLIGIITVMRTGNTMVDYTGHAALVCLVLALIARPISRLGSGLLQCRRVLGVGAFLLSIAHVLHMVEHSWGWNLQALFFMLPQHQWGIWLGVAALFCMLPAALTSFDAAQKRLGQRWRAVHLLAIPALILVAIHSILIGSHYLGAGLGAGQVSAWNKGAVGLLSFAVLGVFLIRWRWIWSLLSWEKFYVAPKK